MARPTDADTEIGMNRTQTDSEKQRDRQTHIDIKIGWLIG